ncbi:MAG: hypothetical protein ABJE95_06540 [Byssovorax sp.]
MRRSWVAFFALAGTFAGQARAAGPTPGFPEPVVQWGVQKGETCDDVAKALYGSAKHVGLLSRYNRVTCKAGVALTEGTTLVLPATVTTIADAKLRSINPDVRARPAGGAWNAAASGMPLYSNSSVNTLDKGRADVEFVDRTRVFLAPNTLVVIYGTANQTHVSKTPPAAVEVESGEVKAGLSALRGDSVEVAIKGGGRVSAASRDTVVERKGERTTVAVFNGKAGVVSGGKTIDVPTNFGSRFVGTAAPIPPRPLPPAPAWAAGGTEAIAFAPAGQGLITATWAPEPKAISYRVELARDETFNDLLAREEVPATVVAFRAEKLPAGTYYLHVRAIDKEEFLGIASKTRQIRLVDAELKAGGGTLKDHAIEANPYGVLGFGAAPDLEMAVDDGAFGPVPAQLDLQTRAPHALHVRARGATEIQTENIDITYVKVSAKIEVARGADGRSLTATIAIAALDGVDVSARAAPHLRAHLPGEGAAAETRTDVALTPGAAPGRFSAVIPLPQSIDAMRPIRLDLVDGRGSVLGTTTADLARPAPPPVLVVQVMPRIGTDAPLWSLSPFTDTVWLAPTATNTASGGVVVGRAGGATVYQGQVRASGAIGALGLDAALRSNPSGNAAPDASAWLGARYRLLRVGQARFELAPSIRFGLPVVSGGPPARFEGAFAAGGASGRLTWLADLGLRVRLRDDNGVGGAPPIDGFLLAGGTADATTWLRFHAVVDAHATHADSSGAKLLGGLGGGLEVGGAIFGAASARVSPFTSVGDSVFDAQLSIGVREARP